VAAIIFLNQITTFHYMTCRTLGVVTSGLQTKRPLQTLLISQVICVDLYTKVFVNLGEA
jgi:hypothetical protein